MKTISTLLELKKLDPERGTFEGYGSTFGGGPDSYGDVIERGAFSKSLAAWKEKDRLPALLWMHQQENPIGKWLEMREDSHGLFVRGQILVNAGELERRAFKHLKAGSVSGLSIGFTLPPSGSRFDAKTGTNRLTEIDLREISIVTAPANDAARVEVVKSAIAGGRREVERLLRDAGFSKSQSRALLAEGFAGLQRPDDEAVDLNAVNAALKQLGALLRG